LFNTSFPYGYDANGAYLLHNGVDTGANLGTPLLAVGDGTIVVAQPDFDELYGWRCDWYGHLVVLELDERWQGQPVYALYGHVLEIKVEEGQRVSAGEEVAEVGFGGAASVPHLHFEVRVGSNDFGSTQNPMLWVIPPESRGLVVGRLIDPSGRPWQGVWLSATDEEGTQSVTWSYLDDPRHLINPDKGFAENFVFTDLVPGRYQLATKIQGVVYTADVEVFGGQITTVQMVTEPYKTVTPTAEASDPQPTTTSTPEP
jgi:murein DD-endopeptidase MepM/ murein hydrolase activator NlpD